MSAFTESKAVRLLADGAIEPDPQPVQSFTVHGDTGSYIVVVGAHVQMCSCPAKGRCSHIAAAVKRVWAKPDELALMDEAVAVAKGHRAAEADDLFARLGA